MSIAVIPSIHTAGPCVIHEIFAATNFDMTPSQVIFVHSLVNNLFAHFNDIRSVRLFVLVRAQELE